MLFQEKIFSMIGIKSRGYICLLICLLGYYVSDAQKNVFTIRQVDSVFAVKNPITKEYDEVFVGNVFLEEKEKQIKFFCDSAYKHSDTQIIEAFRNVQLNRGDTIDLQGEYMSFDLNSNFLKVRKKAKLEHARATLTTDSLDYDMNTEIGAYKYGGKLVDSTSTLTSKIGKYFASNGEVHFKENVVVVGKKYRILTDSVRYNVNTNDVFVIAPTDFNSEEYQMYTEKGVYNTNTGIANFTQATRLINKSYVLTGDKLHYEEKTGVGILTQNCKLVDTLKNMILTGNYMKSNQRDSSVLVTDSLEMQYLMKKDTLFAHSDTIALHKDTLSNDVLEIFRKVKIFKKDLQGKCDSMSFSNTDSIMKMYYEPTIWSSGNQLTADTITAEFVEGKVKYINLLENAVMASVVDDTKSYFNQMKGRKMRGFIENDTIRRVESYGNGEFIYFLLEKEEYIGVNSLRCSDFTIRFKEQKAQEIAFYKKPEGTVYPLADASKISLQLKGFRWDAVNRPKSREDIFKWEEVAELPDDKKNKRNVITEEEPQKDEKDTDKKALTEKDKKAIEPKKKSRRELRRERREARKRNKKR